MKLLICTQVVDRNHQILGFFHRWLEEFSKHCEEVHVVALQVGEYDLPDNVLVHSLGKEDGVSRIHYIINFYKLIWSLRNQYDEVFVHMNQIYVLLGGFFWRMFYKEISLWYMHKSVSVSLRLAEKITHKIFTGSPESFRIPSNKTIVTGHGIDTELFTLQSQVEKTIDLITVGRVSESKNLLTLIDILKEVRKEHDVSLTIVGVAVTMADKEYEVKLKKKITEYDLDKKVIFTGMMYQKDLPNILNQSKIFVTTAQNGSLDKALLEAMACGLPVVSMAPGSASIPLGEAQVNTIEDFTKQIMQILSFGVFVRPDNARYVQQNHSIEFLIPKLIKS